MAVIKTSAQRNIFVKNNVFQLSHGGKTFIEVSCTDNIYTGEKVFCSCFFRRLVSSFFRSSHRRCSVRKGVLRNFAKFTGKHLCQRLFFNKVAGLRPVTLLKKSLWHRCFPVNFAKFLRTPFLQNTSGRLLLFLFRESKSTVVYFGLYIEERAK